jgi:hypothetical protein
MTIELGMILLLIALAVWLMFRLSKVEEGLKWMLENVHVIPGGNDNDPDYERIRKLFKIPDEEE